MRKKNKILKEETENILAFIKLCGMKPKKWQEESLRKWVLATFKIVEFRLNELRVKTEHNDN